MKEDGTAVHVLPVMLVHCPGPGLGVEDPLVAVGSQLWLEEGIELLGLYLLENRGWGERHSPEPRKSAGVLGYANCVCVFVKLPACAVNACTYTRWWSA